MMIQSKLKECVKMFMNVDNALSEQMSIDVKLFNNKEITVIKKNLSSDAVFQPFCALKTKSGIIVLVDGTIYNDVKKYIVAELFEQKTRDDLQNLFTSIYENCDVRTKFFERYAVEREMINKQKIQSTTEILSDNLRKQLIGEVSKTAIYATVIDNLVVSAAGVNNSDENTANIWIETLPKYQKRGFAVSNTAALALKMTKLGIPSIYECRPENLASKCTAISAGFLLHSLELNCFVSKNE